MPGFQSKSMNAAPAWLADDDGNPLGTVANPLNTTGGGGGGSGGVVTQPTASNLNAQVQGPAAAGAAPTGNPLAMGGTVTVTGFPTAAANNTRAEQWLGQYGQPVFGAVSFTAGDNIPNASITTAAPHSGTFTTVRPFATAGWVYDAVNGWQRMRGDASATYTASVASGNVAAAVTPVTAVNAFSLVVKNTAGNFFGGSIVAGATAGYLISYNATAAPTAGATLTAALILGVVQVAANGSAALGDYVVPDRASAGVVLLFSTSLTTYTQPANAAQFLRGRAA